MVNIPKRSISPFETSPSSERTAIERGIQGFYGNWGHRKKHFCASIIAKIWPAGLNIKRNIFLHISPRLMTGPLGGMSEKGDPCSRWLAHRSHSARSAWAPQARDSHKKSVRQTTSWAETSRASFVGTASMWRELKKETNSWTNVKWSWVALKRDKQMYNDDNRFKITNTWAIHPKMKIHSSPHQ